MSLPHSRNPVRTANSTRTLLAAVAVMVLCCVSVCTGETYTEPHNLVIQGKTLSANVIINRPTGYVIIRNCVGKKLIRITGNTSAYITNPPQELTILIEDMTMSETIQVRYLNLHLNSSVTIRDIRSAHKKADLSIVRMVLNATPLRLQQMVQNYFYFRYITMSNGSTLFVKDFTTPAKSTYPNGYLSLLEVNSRENSVMAFDNVVFGWLMMETSSLTASTLTFTNSRLESDGVCVRENCHLNFTDSTLNNAELSFYNTSLIDASFRLINVAMTNKTQVKLVDSSIVANEVSTKRTRYGFVVSSASRVESGTVLNITNTPITLGPNGNIKTTTMRGVQLSPTVRFSTLVIHRSRITAYRGKNTNGNPLYITAFADSTLDIDKYTYENLSPGTSQMRGLEGLTHPIDFTGVNNSGLGMYLRGSMGVSVYADNANMNRLETDSGVLSGAGNGFFVRNSTITTLRFDTNALFDSSSTLEVLDSTITNLQFASVSFTGGTVINVQRIDLKTTFTWPTGSLRGTTAVFNEINFPQTLTLQMDVESSSSFTFENSTLGMVQLTGITIGASSSLTIAGNDITASSTSSVSGSVSGIGFRSGKIQGGAINIRDNNISVTRTNSNVPSPLDIAFGVYLDGTVQISGDSEVQYLRNNVTAIQNGAKGITIRHESPSSGTTAMEYGPPVPAPGSKLTEGKDVVELRLDKNATLVANWCAMWDVEKLALTFIDAARPLVLDGVDSTGIQQLNLDCGGGAGALPVSLVNSRFAGLALTRCVVDDNAPFSLQNSKISGALTWGQTSVAHAAAAIIFNTTIAGGIVNPVPAVRDPTEVDRPPEMMNLFFAGTPAWNPHPCYPDAPRFSYTPTASLTGPTPSLSTSTSATPSSSLAATPTGTESTSPKRTPTTTKQPTTTPSLPRTVTPTSAHTTTRSTSAASTHTSEHTTSSSLESTLTLPGTETILPPPRTPTRSYTPPGTPSTTPSQTISRIACKDEPPVVNETKAAATEEELRGGMKTFALHVGPLAMFAAAVHATAAEPEIQLNASSFTATWTRNGADLPSGMAASGSLPESAASLSVVFSAENRSSAPLGYLRLHLDLSVLDEQSLAFDEVYPTEVIVELEPAFFAAAYCGYRAAAGLVLIEASPETLLDAANALLQGVGDVAAVSSVIAGGGSAGDAISLAILADMSCARPVVKASGHNQRLLSPAAFDSSLPGMLYGSLLLVVLIPALHVAATLGYAKRQGVSRARMIFAMAVTRFPSWTFGTLMVLHQGVTYVSLKLLFVEGPGEHGGGAAFAAVLGLLFAVVVPPAFVFVAARYITATYVRYDYEATPEEARPSACWQRVLPRGRWEVREVRSAYGVMLSPFERPHPMWAAYMFASPSLVAIIAVPTPATTSGCAVQYACMTMMIAAYGLLAFVFRPFRSAINNGLSGTSTASLFGIASMSLVQAASGGKVNVQLTGTLTVFCVFLQMFTTCMRVAYVVFTTFNEARHTVNVVLKPVCRRSPDDVWLAFPCFGMLSSSFAKRRLRAEMQAERGANKLPETFKVPPRMTAKPSELEEALLKKEKGYDPAVLANVHIIDVAALDDVDALLDEKALPDHMFGEDDNEQNWSITDGPTAADLEEGEQREAEGLINSSSRRFVGSKSTNSSGAMQEADIPSTKSSFAPMPMDASLHRDSVTEEMAARMGVSRSNSIFKLLSSVTNHPTDDPLEFNSESGNEENPVMASSAAATESPNGGAVSLADIPASPSGSPGSRTPQTSGSQSPGARSSGAPSEAEYSAATAGMSQFAYEATRKRSVTFSTAPPVVTEISDEEMKPRARSVPPEPEPQSSQEKSENPLDPRIDASVDEMKLSWDRRSASLRGSLDAHSPLPPPRPNAPTRSPSPEDGSPSAAKAPPVVASAAASGAPAPPPTAPEEESSSSSRGPSSHAFSETASPSASMDVDDTSSSARQRASTSPPRRRKQEKRNSLFDVPSFDPKSPTERGGQPLPASTESDAEVPSIANLPPLPPVLAAAMKPSSSAPPQRSSHSRKDASDSVTDESTEWVMADRTAAQLLQVPKPSSGAKKGRRRRSLSVDYVWSSSEGSPPAFLADAPDTPPSAPKVNPLMAAVQNTDSAEQKMNPLMSQGQSGRARGATNKSEARPSIYDLLPSTSRKPMEREKMQPRKRSFSEGPKQRKMSRALSFSL